VSSGLTYFFLSLRLFLTVRVLTTEGPLRSQWRHCRS
jgi:hypothetical protein